VQRVIRTAVMEAGIKPETIDYINGHLTATGADPKEIKSWIDALELKAEQFPLINSTKSLIGHGLGAAGALECVATVLQMAHGFVHGSLNCEDLHEEIAVIGGSVPHRTVDKDIRIAAKASFGFGDVNSCILFRNWR
jgi:3-oxoacyl-(acyl-carrier-protein) synthase